MRPPARQAGGLDELIEAEQLPVESPRLLLAARWRRHLHVIQTEDSHPRRQAYCLPPRGVL